MGSILCGFFDSLGCVSGERKAAVIRNRQTQCHVTKAHLKDLGVFIWEGSMCLIILKSVKDSLSRGVRFLLVAP